MLTCSSPATALQNVNPGRSAGVYTTLGMSLLLVILSGVTIVLQGLPLAQRYHAEHLVPWGVAMRIFRSSGPACAAVVACLVVTLIVHRRSLEASTLSSLGGPTTGPTITSTGNRIKDALLAACAVPILYLPLSAVALVSAMVSTSVLLGIGPAEFFSGLLPLFRASDVAYGAFAADILGAVPALWTLIAARFFSSPRRGLGSKLFFTWLGMAGFAVPVGAVMLLVD